MKYKRLYKVVSGNMKKEMFEVENEVLSYVESLKGINDELYRKILIGPTQEDNVKKAVEVLAWGGIVIFYSSATYGLAANAWDKGAIDKIYRIKKRDKNKPLSILTNKNKYKNITNLETDEQKVVEALIDKFCPGYVGIICNKKKDMIPNYVNAGFETINIVCMDMASAMLAEKADFPIAVTSANHSGETPITNALQALECFKEEELIDLFLLGPKSQMGVNTTLVKVTDIKNLEIIRPGPVAGEEIIRVAKKALTS
ncbi:L-threonylcarbamoyladenylate synthase [Aceticella autotrophica]|uniref:L-threonylcarbamoyladenylate synthase n=1 Tax=Aceticella autotrophica TaxID=2755338 RepID=A0A975AWB2_9THEO|nr:L-threonylcarbamoyladenylate synthase [Aceticella autotrophica]QSZ27682.1 L-threonylcarbamoyladenylate synthase [Aceticella autotrophica]